MFPVLVSGCFWTSCHQAGLRHLELAQCVQRSTVLSFKSSSSAATSQQLPCSTPDYCAFLSTSFTKCVLMSAPPLWTAPPVHWPLPSVVPHRSPVSQPLCCSPREYRNKQVAEDPGGFIIWKENVLGHTWNWICRHCGNLWKFLFPSHELQCLCIWSWCSPPLDLVVLLSRLC